MVTSADDLPRIKAVDVHLTRYSTCATEALLFGTLSVIAHANRKRPYGRFLHQHGDRGWVSLEFEGMEDPRTAIPRSFELLPSSFPREVLASPARLDRLEFGTSGVQHPYLLLATDRRTVINYFILLVPSH